MIKIITGDILESQTKGLVNTVNLEGYMGKGIAYQFKNKYPENNEAYKKACKNGQIGIGKVFSSEEGGKVIYNFPTKDKWREKSEIEYISKGMTSLVDKLNNSGVDSVSIPPLGCGNGGLKWLEVREVIYNKLKLLNRDIEVLIYAPNNKKYISVSKNKPKLSTSHLILMEIKFSINGFSKFRLQKAAYFLNAIKKDEYFKFTKYEYGPYSYPIEILSKDIQDFQRYYNTASTKEAYEIAIKELVSRNVQRKLDEFKPHIRLVSKFMNEISNNRDLELLSSLHLLITNESRGISYVDMKLALSEWNERKRIIFSDKDIEKSISVLEIEGLIRKDIEGKYLAV